MNRIPLLLLFSVVFINSIAQSGRDHGRLKVTSDGYYLQYEDGTPFFWLGDTGWEILGKLRLEEMRMYLDNRAAKGFNVIQVMNLSDHDMESGNRYGEFPFVGSDPTLVNEKYYAIADSLIRMARTRKMMVAVVVAWGERVVSKSGNGPMLFDSLKAYRYGRWIGSRYKDFPNMIWIMGGDRPAIREGVDYRPVWRAMANGIIESTGHRCLITYHPNGERSSSLWVHEEPWLDFNMIQSSHGRKDAPTWEMVKSDRSKTPVKPTLDSEPNYEDHPVNPWPVWKVEYGYFRDYDVRKQLYRSVFAGGLGVTYGHHAIWQFMSERDEVINFADRGWRNAMDRPGAVQAGYLRRLMESRPLEKRIPDTALIAEGQGEKGEHMEAFRGVGHDYAMIYLPVGKTVSVNMEFMNGKSVVAWWFNPRDASVQKVGPLARAIRMKFTPPDGNDWVLVMDDASKNFAAPGH
jgi:Protein of unknown function (DUF4038)/Putative collagen-binding domain of a collagenase